MGRLTEREPHWLGEEFWVSAQEPDEEELDEVYMKLKHYEDLEEQGRLIELPCAVGDTIYELWYTECHNGETHPHSYGCCGCEDKCDIKRTVREQKVHSAVWLVNYLSYFGSHYFLTKEEAEAKLKELTP